jgi:alkanesulfonate monooxygenase SsuD/methylene tetrahydromethanopterin reductase-like flavin-dependent oxidoreductase (luciferase family)
VPEFGLYLSLQHPAHRDPRQLVAERIEQVALARDGGLDGVFSGQHFLVPPDVQMLQPVPMLARVAAASGDLTLGTAVLVGTLLNPLEVAENAATLAALTNGRFVLGLGLGYRQEEDDAFGVMGRRVATFMAKASAVRALLEGGEVTAEGPGFRLERARLTSLPGRRPEVWIAATSDAGIRRAAELGDAWLAAPMARTAEIRRHRTLLHDLLGREPVVAALREAVLAPTDAEARALAAPFLRPVGTSSAGTVDLEPGRYIVGSPDTARRELQDLLDAGVTYVVFRVQRPGVSHADALRTIELLAANVLPSFRH